MTKREKTLNKKFTYVIFINLLIVFMIMFIDAICVEVSENNQNEGESNLTYESYDHNVITSPANASNTTTMPMEEIIEEVEETAVEVKETTEIFSRNLSKEDKYLLAKIAMAEAEGETFETKVLVILSVLNRVYSTDKYFPNTVRGVIFQSHTFNGKTVYQYSPVMPDGRWWNVEPNEDCYKAVEIVNMMEEDLSNGALYFESCRGESWHSKNLEFLFKSDDMRFYK